MFYCLIGHAAKKHYATFLVPDGFGEKVHMASPIKQTGASKSQTPIPNFWPAGEGPSDELSVASCMGATGATVEDCCVGKGDGAELGESGRKSRCGEACVHCGEFGKLGADTGVEVENVEACIADD